MNAPTLRGARVVLRAPHVGDLPYLVTFANDAELRGWLRFWRPMTRPEEAAWLQGTAHGDDIAWVMTRPDDDKPFGSIGLHGYDRVANNAELGLGILHASDRGQGLGEEACRLALRHAFEGLNMERVYLSVLDDNPALRLYERLGFRREGTLRRHGWKRGAWHDQHAMGMLREEWRA